ncbi:hypothetical protein GCM10023321_74760 [Pseudonocardia eucalypti]|uniref:Uncharacterized protein n=1 Tax=Pseudonocardia eucalypti TaxID=648755 RepID=A0ABP9RA83_9PSEU
MAAHGGVRGTVAVVGGTLAAGGMLYSTGVVIDNVIGRRTHGLSNDSLTNPDAALDTLTLAGNTLGAGCSPPHSLSLPRCWRKCARLTQDLDQSLPRPLQVLPPRVGARAT